LKILTIVGARPQFIKAACVSRIINNNYNNIIKEVIVHTGQHFDSNMSNIFFKELNIPKPKYNLGISNLSHAAMTARMMDGIERIILREKPNCVLLYGDTNSTLAGALAAVKQNFLIAHVEAGCRSNNFNMPEEINRIVTDRISTLLFCPTKTAVKNLKGEGFPFLINTINKKNKKQKIYNVGDVMFDSVKYYKNTANKFITFDKYGLKYKGYALCTLHRQENIDNDVCLKSIFNALKKIAKDLTVVLLLHPRLKIKLIKKSQTNLLKKLKILSPLSYLEFQNLKMCAKFILTDSGGVQKEAFFHQVPCITFRNETEWIETVSEGWNQLVGTNSKKIVNAVYNIKLQTRKKTRIFGNGDAANKIIKLIIKNI
jgi:UDP-GlcNAc3NAcA epimerase